MADNDQQGVLVLRASRRKWFAVLAVSLVFTSGGVAVVTDGRPLGWVPLVVFAVVALVATAAIVWRPQLRIDPDGMTLVQWWRQVHYDFRDCSEFMTWQNPFALGNTLVVFDHRTGDGSNPWLSSRLNARVSGVNSGLPDTFSLSADELARLLNDRRRRVVDRVEP